MDAFGYLSVLLSIILGLAVTQLLTGVRGLMLWRAQVRLYWPALVWVGVLLAVVVQTWWAMFGLRGVRVWTFADFAVVLLQTVVLYLVAGLALPDFGDRPTDLRAHYFAHRGWFFGLTVALGLVSLAKDLVIAGRLPVAANVAFHATFMAAGIALAVSGRPRLHEALAAAMPVGIALYIVLLFSRLA